MSHLPKTIEKLSLDSCSLPPKIKFTSSEIREMFPHLTEVELFRSCLDWFPSKPAFLPWWNCRFKRFIMRGSNGVWYDQIQVFPKTEQNSLREFLDLTNFPKVALSNLKTKTRPSVYNSVTGRNMPELREIRLRCTRDLNDRFTIDDGGLYDLLGGDLEEVGANPLLKLEILDLRGTAVTGEGMD
jgi:hypothetical protein